MKILVTGGAGFIGSNFINYVLEKYKNDSIVNLDLLTYAGNIANCKKWENDDRYSFVEGDICDSELVNRLVSEVDAVVHFAAESHVDRSNESGMPFAKTNVLGTLTLLEAVLKNGKKRFHHVSTDEVFGQLTLDEKPFTENTPYSPRNPYSASKASSDHFVRSYYQTHGLPITISNCSNNYGFFHHPEKLIPLAITNILEGKKVPIYGKGNQIRDWLFVTDHCRAIDLILREGKIGETYCVGGDNQPTNLEIVKILIDLLDAKEDECISYVDDRIGHDFRYDIDYTKINKELGWSPSVNLKEGLEKTVKWYKENESWWKPIKARS